MGGVLLGWFAVGIFTCRRSGVVAVGGVVVRRTERFGGWNQGQAGESQKGCWGTSDVSQHFSAMDSSEGL